MWFLFSLWVCGPAIWAQVNWLVVLGSARFMHLEWAGMVCFCSQNFDADQIINTLLRLELGIFKPSYFLWARGRPSQILWMGGLLWPGKGIFTGKENKTESLTHNLPHPFYKEMQKVTPSSFSALEEYRKESGNGNQKYLHVEKYQNRWGMLLLVVIGRNGKKQSVRENKEYLEHGCVVS